METTIYKIELSNNCGCIYTMTPKGQILSEAIVTVREVLSFAGMKGLSFMEEDVVNRNQKYSENGNGNTVKMGTILR